MYALFSHGRLHPTIGTIDIFLPIHLYQLLNQDLAFKHSSVYYLFIYFIIYYYLHLKYIGL